MIKIADYINYIDWNVVVHCKDGQVIKGKLLSVDDKEESGLGEDGITVDNMGIGVSEIERLEVSKPRVWWLDNPEVIGEHLFTFDGEIVFNLFADYPWRLSEEQKEIFDEENPYWKDFFKDRQ